jgi:hypothetical protein
MASTPPSARMARLRSALGLALLATLAAALAWVASSRALGHDAPVLAPLAALAMLAALRGAQGGPLGALAGVAVGGLAGAVVAQAVGDGDGALALAVLGATVVVALAGAPPLVTVWSGAGATAVVTAGSPGALGGAADAALGAAIAFVLSSVLAPQEPLEALRRAECTALRALADGLDLLAHAIREDSEAGARRATEEVRAARGVLVAPPAARRRGRAAMHRELERARRLEDLTASTLVLVRVTSEAPPELHESLVEGLHELERGLRVLADAPHARRAREHAVERALGAVRASAIEPVPVDDALAAAPFVALRLVARDVVALVGARAAEPTADEAAVVAVPAVPAGAMREAS